MRSPPPTPAAGSTSSERCSGSRGWSRRLDRHAPPSIDASTGRDWWRLLARRPPRAQRSAAAISRGWRAGCRWRSPTSRANGSRATCCARRSPRTRSSAIRRAAVGGHRRHAAAARSPPIRCRSAAASPCAADRARWRRRSRRSRTSRRVGPDRRARHARRHRERPRDRRACSRTATRLPARAVVGGDQPDSTVLTDLVAPGGPAADVPRSDSPHPRARRDGEDQPGAGRPAAVHGARRRPRAARRPSAHRARSRLPRARVRRDEVRRDVRAAVARDLDSERRRSVARAGGRTRHVHLRALRAAAPARHDVDGRRDALARIGDARARAARAGARAHSSRAKCSRRKISSSAGGCRADTSFTASRRSIRRGPRARCSAGPTTARRCAGCTSPAPARIPAAASPACSGWLASQTVREDLQEANRLNTSGGLQPAGRLAERARATVDVALRELHRASAHARDANSHRLAVRHQHGRRARAAADGRAGRRALAAAGDPADDRAAAAAMPIIAASFFFVLGGLDRDARRDLVALVATPRSRRTAAPRLARPFTLPADVAAVTVPCIDAAGRQHFDAVNRARLPSVGLDRDLRP